MLAIMAIFIITETCRLGKLFGSPNPKIQPKNLMVLLIQNESTVSLKFVPSHYFTVAKKCAAGQYV